MTTADELRAARFAQTQFAPGYDEREVDTFLDRATAALERLEAGGAPGSAGLTVADVRAARFTPTRMRRGYDMADVDAVLDAVAATLEAAGDGSATAAPVAAKPAAGAAPAAGAVTPREGLGARILRTLRGDPRP